MLHSVGSGVMRLERVRVGGLTLDGAEEPGAWRRLEDAELLEELGYSYSPPSSGPPPPKGRRATKRPPKSAPRSRASPLPPRRRSRRGAQPPR